MRHGGASNIFFTSLRCSDGTRPVLHSLGEGGVPSTAVVFSMNGRLQVRNNLLGEPLKSAFF